jgi:hypothetical protein
VTETIDWAEFRRFVEEDTRLIRKLLGEPEKSDSAPKSSSTASASGSTNVFPSLERSGSSSSSKPQGFKAPSEAPSKPGFKAQSLGRPKPT